MFDYSVVIFFEDHHPGEIVKLKEASHIVLKRRFKLKNISLVSLTHILDRISSQYPKLTIIFGKTGYFSQDNSLIEYVEIKNADTLQYLHDSIAEGLAGEILSKDTSLEGESYFPHMTTNYEAKVKSDDRAKYLNKKKVMRNFFLIEEIDAKKGLWRVVEEFSLGSFNIMRR